MTKIFLLGSRGRLGASIHTEMSTLSHSVICVPRDSYCDVAYWRNVRRDDVVINCASMTDVDACEIERDAAYKANVEPTEAMVAAKLPARLVLISTDMATSPDGTPQNWYGMTKHFAENEALKIPGASIIRTSGLFYKKGGSFPKAIFDRAWEGSPIKVPPIRSRATSGEWLAKRIGTMMEKRWRAGVVAFAGSEIMTRIELAKMVLSLAGVPDYPVETGPVLGAAPRAMDSVLEGAPVDFGSIEKYLKSCVFAWQTEKKYSSIRA